MIVGESSTVKIGLGLMAYNQMLSSTVYSTVHPMTVMGARSCFLLRSPEDSIVPKPKQTVVPSLFTAYRLEIKRNGKGIKEKLSSAGLKIKLVGVLDLILGKANVNYCNKSNKLLFVVKGKMGTAVKTQMVVFGGKAKIDRYVDPTITHLAYGLLDYSAEEFKHAVTIENQLNQTVKIIRSDNRIEFKNRVMLEFCGEKGIKQEFSNARTPQQNGVAERMMDPYRGVGLILLDYGFNFMNTHYHH
ncbi:putative ribonuclease H-like domain-containing protein [Tanacetum coccineum]